MPQQFASIRLTLESGHTVDARRHAHSIKGAASNIGAEAVRELAAHMEAAAKESRLDLASEGLAELERRFAEFARVAEVPEPDV